MPGACFCTPAGAQRSGRVVNILSEELFCDQGTATFYNRILLDGFMGWYLKVITPDLRRELVKSVLEFGVVGGKTTLSYRLLVCGYR